MHRRTIAFRPVRRSLPSNRQVERSVPLINRHNVAAAPQFIADKHRRVRLIKFARLRRTERSTVLAWRGTLKLIHVRFYGGEKRDALRFSRGGRTLMRVQFETRRAEENATRRRTDASTPLISPQLVSRGINNARNNDTLVITERRGCNNNRS